MAFKYLDRAQHAAVGAPGTGSIVLSNALAGYQTFAQAGAFDGDTFSYLIVDGTTWEYGVGTYSSIGTFGTLLRTSVTKTSNQNTTPISFSSKCNVTAVLRAEDLANLIGPVGPVGPSGPSVVHLYLATGAPLDFGQIPDFVSATEDWGDLTTPSPDTVDLGSSLT